MHKIQGGAGAKHSDMKIYVFYQSLSPECFAPTEKFCSLEKIRSSPLTDYQKHANIDANNLMGGKTRKNETSASG